MLTRLDVRTAGESHGRGMLAWIGGFPAGVPLETERIDAMLARRQAGYGRSARQRIEHDRVDVLSGVVRGRTSGAPIVLAVWNEDQSLEERPPLERPRPGHGDLAGGQKYHRSDMRPVLERASARETAARVAAGALAACLLERLGVEVFGHVLQVGAAAVREPKRVTAANLAALRRRRDRSAFACLEARAETTMRRAVDRARKAGDTLGGRIEMRALGVPPGLGSLTTWESRLDARLGAAMLSVPAMKAVEIGDGLDAAGEVGSAVHDAVLAPGPSGPRRRGNRAGGVEAGMSNGEDVVVRAWMKPLATLARPLPSWDYGADRAGRAFVERSDVTAVPAASVVGEAMLALVLLDALLEKTGGDSFDEVRAASDRHRKAVARTFGRPPARARPGRRKGRA
ncbi:MAG: chorismate synthase [Planctomycetota bacterium]